MTKGKKKWTGNWDMIKGFWTPTDGQIFEHILPIKFWLRDDLSFTIKTSKRICTDKYFSKEELENEGIICLCAAKWTNLQNCVIDNDTIHIHNLITEFLTGYHRYEIIKNSILIIYNGNRSLVFKRSINN